MRWILMLTGGLLVVAGIVWIFQGTGALKGSFMTGSSTWLWIGVAAVAAGTAAIVRGVGGKPSGAASDGARPGTRR